VKRHPLSGSSSNVVRCLAAVIVWAGGQSTIELRGKDTCHLGLYHHTMCMRLDVAKALASDTAEEYHS
jgi:hypothetical protein